MEFREGQQTLSPMSSFPHTLAMAKRRFRCIEKRLEKEPELYDSVWKQVADYAFKGYVHVVEKDEMAEFDPRRTW